jgi:fructose-specific PTS system IIA-like component
MPQDLSKPAEFTFACPLPNGLHARPASELAEFATRLESEVSLINQRNGSAANLKSTLGILAADIRHGDQCTVRIEGEGTTAAERALREFILHQLPKTDAPLAVEICGFDALPRGLLSPDVRYHTGLGVSPGIGRGTAVGIAPVRIPAKLADEAEDRQAEGRRLERALDAVRERTRGMLSRAISPAEAGVLRAHLALLDDVTFSERLQQGIAHGYSAGKTVADCGEHFSSLLSASDSAYIRDRAIDIQDISARLLQELYGSESFIADASLSGPSVLVAETLAPQQLLASDRRWIRALVLEYAGTTSHTIILARSLGIPAVVGVKNAPAAIRTGEEIVVDANRGLVVSNGIATVHRFYERELRTLSRRQEKISSGSSAPAATVDGRALAIAANVSSSDEIRTAFMHGADAIGLFRTEMLFIGHGSPPDEEVQFEIYREAVCMAGRRTVTIRSLDIGGDKPIAHLHFPEESNPYLGYRGIRIYADHSELFRTQLRAILRASAFGRVQMMAPMVSTLDEVRWLKSQIREVQQELSAESVAFDAGMRVGIMIEVPSVAFILDQLCAEVDFFSIGTNDLNQYFMAADRDNARVAALSNVRHPSFLRFLKHIVDAVHAGGKHVAMCGEMAGDLRNLPLLIGLGLDEISAASPQIPFLKKQTASLFARRCRELLDRAMKCLSVQEVEKQLEENYAGARTRALLDPELVITASESRTKEEAIRELVDALYIAGRTEQPDALEQAVWAREAAYATGVGHGFAIPHGRSDTVKIDSVALLKLQAPIAWGSLDDEPVKTVVLLAVRESSVDHSHMQVLAKLARKLMDETFRQGLAERGDSNEIAKYIATELQLSL